MKFGVVKFIFREVSGFLGLVLTMNGVLWGVFIGKKSSIEISSPIKSASFEILPNSNEVKFGFAPYLGGILRVYMGF